MLGPGYSGKSTIFKQFRQIHGNGFNDKDRLVFKEQIHSQCIEEMRTAIEYLEEYNENAADDDTLNQLQLSDAAIKAKKVLEEYRDYKLNDDIVSAIKCLWMEPGIKKMHKIWANKISDSSAYFWDELDRINKSNYIPNDKDIFSVRYRTTG